MSIQDDLFDIEDFVKGTEVEDAFRRISYLFGKFEEELEVHRADKAILKRAKAILEAL